MPFVERDGLRWYEFDCYAPHGLIQGIFTRRGGVSPAPWDSLNQGGLVGDLRENVIENRKRIFDVMRRPVEGIFDTWLVHGTVTLCADQPRPLDALHAKADAILTDRPAISLFMRFADCTPIFLYDPVRRVVGMAHAGWRGTVDGMAAAAVATMTERYATRAADVLAAIGPAICVDDYPVGPDLIAAAQAAFGKNADAFLPQMDGRTHFDLWAANRHVLQSAGVEQIETCGICTAEAVQDWYSHRAEHGKTGRFGAIFALGE